MELLAQLLLESRAGAYIEWLGNELIMTANNKIYSICLGAFFGFYLLSKN